VPPAERESQSEGDRPSGSTSSRPPLPVPSSRGHLSRGSSTSSRGRLTPVRGAHASRAPTPSLLLLEEKQFLQRLPLPVKRVEGIHSLFT
jgi:hypothetical protein